MSVSDKIINIALNEQKMFSFMENLQIVDECPCNCDPGCCVFTKFLMSLKNCFKQNIKNEEKRRLFISHCLKHKYIFENVNNFM